MLISACSAWVNNKNKLVILSQSVRPGMSHTTSRNLILQTFRFRGEKMGECENCEPSWFPG